MIISNLPNLNRYTPREFIDYPGMYRTFADIGFI